MRTYICRKGPPIYIFIYLFIYIFIYLFVDIYIFIGPQIDIGGILYTNILRIYWGSLCFFSFLFASLARQCQLMANKGLQAKKRDKHTLEGTTVSYTAWRTPWHKQTQQKKYQFRVKMSLALLHAVTWYVQSQGHGPMWPVKGPTRHWLFRGLCGRSTCGGSLFCRDFVESFEKQCAVDRLSDAFLIMRCKTPNNTIQ